MIVTGASPRILVRRRSRPGRWDVWVIALVLLVGGARLAAGAAPLLLRAGHVVDARGARGPVDILLRDGRIAAIAPAIPGDGAHVLDLDGGTVVPGLIDAHVHLMEVPGAGVRGDGPAFATALRHRQLRAYLACGVTTVLDTGIRIAVARELRGWLARRHPGPRFLTLGPPIAPRHGYMSLMEPSLTVGGVGDLDRVFDAVAGVGAVGVKVPIERGFGVDDAWPIHPPDVRAAIVRQAAARRLPIYVHASDEVEQSIGLDMGAHALLHTNFGGREPSPEFIARAAASGVTMVTTFSIIDAYLPRWHPERLADPLVRATVPRPEQRTAREPGAWDDLGLADVAEAFPHVPRFILRRIARLPAPPTEAVVQRVLAANLRAAAALHAAGVPLAIGSDAGNSFTLTQFHGVSTVRELELLAEAGLSPGDVLAAATVVPARLLRLEDELGTVEVGKRADLVVLRDDPSRDVHAFRTVEWTIRDGVARTPAAWMGRRSR